MRYERGISFVSYFWFCCASVMWSMEFTPTDKDNKSRAEIIRSIKHSNYLNQSFSYCCDAFSGCTPDSVKECLDNCGAYFINAVGSFSSFRKMIKHFAFKPDKIAMAQYDNIVKVHTAIPDHPVKIESLRRLIREAKKEKFKWQDGQMSGAIYDGSKQHREKLMEFFANSLTVDPLMKAIFHDDKEAKQLAVEAFRQFQTANPLHGSSCPLAVKAMRELSAMMAALVNRQHGIVTSGGNEALRIGLSTLKKIYSPTHSVSILIRGDEKKILENMAESLHLKIANGIGDSTTKFMAFYLEKNTLNKLRETLSLADLLNLKLHIHIDNGVFRQLFSDLDNDFDYLLVHPTIASLSFDTEGIFYQGMSGVVFADAGLFHNALGAYIDWLGGMYPEITTAGSLPGVDHIICYLLLLHKGKAGLIEQMKHVDSAEILQRQLSKNPIKETLHKELARILIDDFNQRSEVDIHPLLMKILPQYSYLEYRDLFEEMMADVSLSVFGAKENYNAIITSGGTESNRLALQAYRNLFKQKHPYHQPLFLMAKTAHVSFEREVNQIDAKIEWVLHDEKNKTMNVDDLRKKLAQHQNIAGIIVSLADYSFGAVDNIREIGKMALAHDIPLHVDGCMGGWILRFVDGEFSLDLSGKYFGITSFSSDFHKFATTAKGLSMVAFKKSIFAKENLPKNICALRTVSQLEVGLATLLHIGNKGYKKRALGITQLASELSDELSLVDGIELVTPVNKSVPHFVVAFRLKDPLVDLTYTMASFMSKLGWDLNSLNDYTLHMVLTNTHKNNPNFLAKFISDIRFVVGVIKKNPQIKPTGMAGLYGMAANLNFASMLGNNEAKRSFLKLMVNLYGDFLISAQ